MTDAHRRALPFRAHRGPGRLVTVEGLDGAGKTTVVELLRQSLTREGVPVMTTRLPTTRMRESRFFELVQKQGRTDVVDPVAFEVAYMVDRIQHCHEWIEPEIRRGTTVITDRYALSSIGTLLLRLADLREVALNAVFNETWFAGLCNYLVQPDLAIVLRVDPVIAISRLRARPGEHDIVANARDYGVLQGQLLELAGSNGMVPIDSSGSPELTLAECAMHLKNVQVAPGQANP